MTDSLATVECKLRAKFVHHTLLRDAQADAKKHGKDPKWTFLYTKLKGERGEAVVMDAATFHEHVLPILKPLLTKPLAASGD